jgi:[ribosomal protein S18]-alanine N-acetyltransferase
LSSNTLETIFVSTKLSVEAAEQIAQVQRACNPLPWSIDSVRAELSLLCTVALGVRIQGELVGYLLSHVIEDEAHILDFGVSPSWRGLGLAKLLLKDFFEQLTARHVGKITLEVRESNQAAVTLYKSFGFNEVCKRLKYYRDSGEDALLMVCLPNSTGVSATLNKLTANE